MASCASLKRLLGLPFTFYKYSLVCIAMVKKTSQHMKGQKNKFYFCGRVNQYFLGILKRFFLELNFKELQKTQNNSIWDGKKPLKSLIF